MGRKLSPEEVAQLGLDAPAPAPAGSGAATPASTPPPPPPAPAEKPNILRQYLDALSNAPGHGRAGGIVGGIAGGILTGGDPVGAGAGAYLGNLVGQRLQIGTEGLSAEQLAQLQARRLPLNYVPAHPPADVDQGAALADGLTQGGLAGVFRGAGSIAARGGFPRLAGVLGGRTPQEAVAATASPAVRGVSTPSLQSVDAATLAGNPAAKEIAAIAAEQARRDAVLATERGMSERAMPPIQGRMAARVPGLANKTRSFVDELSQAVPPEKLDKAFVEAPSVPEAASSVPVMQARQGMIQEAVPQTVDNQALKLARRPLAAAEARGVSGPPGQFAADAAGLREMGGNLPMDNSYLTRVVNRVPGVGTAMQALPRGGMAPDRVAQTTAALLAERGGQTINPELARLISESAAYRASAPGQATTEALREFLANRAEGNK